MAASMDLATETTPNHIQRAVVDEAGLFSGDKLFDSNNPGGAWELILGIGSTVTSAISFASQSALLIRTLMRGAGGNGLNDVVTWGNCLLITLSLSSGLLSSISNRLYTMLDRRRDAKQQGILQSTLEERALSGMLKDDSSRNELVLFGLKDWTLERWDARHRRSTIQLEYQAAEYLQAMQFLFQTSIQNLFYVSVCLDVCLS